MILIRHGQTIFNVIFSVTRIDPGVPDPLLTSRGRSQAREVAASLAGEGVERIVTSPYRRALQTADTVARALGVAATIDPDVRERFSFSCDHGTRRSGLARAWPEYDFAHLEERWWPRSEESETAFAARCAVLRAYGGQPGLVPHRRHHPLGRHSRVDRRTGDQRKADPARQALNLYTRSFRARARAVRGEANG